MIPAAWPRLRERLRAAGIDASEPCPVSVPDEMWTAIEELLDERDALKQASGIIPCHENEQGEYVPGPAPEEPTTSVRARLFCALALDPTAEVPADEELMRIAATEVARLAHDYGTVLDYVTDGRMSKTGYDLAAVRAEIDDAFTRAVDEARKEWEEEKKDEAVPEACSLKPEACEEAPKEGANAPAEQREAAEEGTKSPREEGWERELSKEELRRLESLRSTATNLVRVGTQLRKNAGKPCEEGFWPEFMQDALLARAPVEDPKLLDAEELEEVIAAVKKHNGELQPKKRRG